MRKVSEGVMKAVSAILPWASWEAIAVTIPTTRRFTLSRTGAPLKPGVI
jgi:hypothetical protein